MHKHSRQITNCRFQLQTHSLFLFYQVWDARFWRVPGPTSQTLVREHASIGPMCAVVAGLYMQPIASAQICLEAGSGISRTTTYGGLFSRVLILFKKALVWPLWTGHPSLALDRCSPLPQPPPICPSSVYLGHHRLGSLFPLPVLPWPVPHFHLNRPGAAGCPPADGWLTAAGTPAWHFNAIQKPYLARNCPDPLRHLNPLLLSAIIARDISPFLIVERRPRCGGCLLVRCI